MPKCKKGGDGVAVLSLIRPIFLIGLSSVFCQLAFGDFRQTQPQQCFADVKLAYTFLLTQEHAMNNPMIDINTATAADFLTLKGVGVKTAEAIVAYRQTMGRFNSVDDLVKVKGVGQKTLENNRHRLRVQ